MADISMDVVIGQLLGVLDETFIYKSKPWTYFTDNKPDAGFLGLLATVHASDASRNIGGTSIAAHAHHINFSLHESASWIRGDHSQRDWKQSWSITTVDDAAWARMKEEMHSAYADLREAIQTQAASSIEAFGGAAGVIGHMAFHLGAIRQKVALLRQ